MDSTAHCQSITRLDRGAYTRRVMIAFSVNAETTIVAIQGVFYGGQDFEQLLRETDNDD
jgi:hypothetical protein